MTEAVDLQDVQGLVLNGYGDRPDAAYGLFVVTHDGRARAFLSRLVDRVQGADFLASGRDRAPFLKATCLNVAFTYRGLGALGLGADALSGMQTAFREGMDAPHRARARR